MFWTFLQTLFGLFGRFIGELDKIVLGDGIVQAGFFSLMIGFLVVRILLGFLINQSIQ